MCPLGWRLLRFMVFRNLLISLKWLCIGDFNDFSDPRDKRGGAFPCMSHISQVREMCDVVGLRDMGFHGYQFTWSNKRLQLYTMEERIDFGLANEAWGILWAVCDVYNLMRHRSDHNPTFLVCELQRWPR